MGLEWISLFFFVSFRFFSFPCRFFGSACLPVRFFFVFLRFFRFFFVFFFFVFLRFSSFQENLVFSAHLQAVVVDGPPIIGYGENCKKAQKREFRSDPVYTNPVRNFPIQNKLQEDVNGEKRTVKKYGGFLVPIFHGLRRVFHGL